MSLMTPMMKMRLANKGRGSFRAEGDVIWLYDVIASDDDEADWIGGVSPRAFIGALAETTGPVTLRINSPGGSVFGAQAMVAAMRAHPEPIVARIDSLAASAASVIASEAAECEIAPGAMMMIHKAWGLTIGNADDFTAMADLLSRLDGQLAKTYARRSGEHDAEAFLDMMAAETWFEAEEAVTAGLADRVLEENLQRPAARWDLSAYQAAPWDPAAPDADNTNPAPVASPDPEPASLQAEARLRRQRVAAARIAALHA
ncbi:Clp protease ClpP [Rhodobacterales bacterium HKCCE4037]|nr:Clp protease ClpP [Rhodobacterales bacterium HKCCE4037]